MKPDDLAGLLERPCIAVLATLRRDGRPYTVPVWWLWDPQEAVFWLTGTYSRVWCRQLLKDPRTSLCIEHSGMPITGRVEADGVGEPRELPGFDIWPISRRLAEKYIGGSDPSRAQPWTRSSRT